MTELEPTTFVIKPLIWLGDRVLAEFPSGWKLGGVVIMIVKPNIPGRSWEYTVQFSDNTHQSFSAEFITPLSP